MSPCFLLWQDSWVKIATMGVRHALTFHVHKACEVDINDHVVVKYLSLRVFVESVFKAKVLGQMPV